MNKNMDIAKQLGKLFVEKDMEDNHKIEQQDYRMYMDPANVIGVIPKTTQMKTLIESEFDVKPQKVPESIEYVYDGSCGEGVSDYSREYMKVLLTIATKSKCEKITIKLKQEYPLWVETEELICVLAPRVRR
jgi:hypothetical protein